MLVFLIINSQESLSFQLLPTEKRSQTVKNGFVHGYVLFMQGTTF